MSARVRTLAPSQGQRLDRAGIAFMQLGHEMHFALPKPPVFAGHCHVPLN